MAGARSPAAGAGLVARLCYMLIHSVEHSGVPWQARVWLWRPELPSTFFFTSQTHGATRPPAHSRGRYRYLSQEPNPTIPKSLLSPICFFLYQF